VRGSGSIYFACTIWIGLRNRAERTPGTLLPTHARSAREEIERTSEEIQGTRLGDRRTSGEIERMSEEIERTRLGDRRTSEEIDRTRLGDARLSEGIE
jgi:hypothetical protein